ncbi:hypothetical protein IW261DRAFT_1563536 [Armillaria novae-zelandiae]|uniref:Uncharacterized protein n=1 Tax=Armillaria novae-zelandiae TaxID=153914 RepID=A0AA39UJ01_9AGAR|nr:hypothetical protein IW261DRAFT_1563536 [Armillaria novae-zelandiae]
MATQTDIPPDLSDDDKALLFQSLDVTLNGGIMYALLHGIYTGILAVTLWNIFINKCWPIRRALVVVIIFLYAVTTVDFAASWSCIPFGFIENGQNFWTVYLNLGGPPQAFWEMQITATISTILADSYMIWCCWMIWGQHWLVALLPIISLVAAIVSRTMSIYYNYIGALTPTNLLLVLYISFNLATTLSCTLLIICRIVAVTGVRHGAVGRLGVYRRFMEVLVESSALYSVSLILDLVFATRENINSGVGYLNIIVSVAKGVAPTLLIGRAAAGHTRPRDDTNKSTLSSLHFQAPAEPSNQTSSQPEESPIQSAVLTMDIEAQPERG